MGCQNCGMENAPNRVVCQNCGERLTLLTARTTRSMVHSRLHRQQLLKQSRAKRCGWSYQRWLLGGLIGCGLIGGGYAVVRHVSAQTAIPAKHSRTTNGETTRTKAPAAGYFPTAAIRKNITQALASMNGTTSVAVLPLIGRQAVIVNNQSQRAGSLITLFIMAAAYEQVHQNNWHMDDYYTLRVEDQVGGTGTLQTLPAGSQLTYAEITKRMITESDNTAANIMLARIGGVAAVNAEVTRLGLKETKMARRLMDTAALEAGADNYTSVSDVATLLRRLANHQLISKKADHAMLAILKANTDHRKLVKNLPTRATVYNKTGDYPAYGVQNDAAIVKNHQGTFIMTAMTTAGDRNGQVLALNQLGQDLYHTILTR